MRSDGALLCRRSWLRRLGRGVSSASMSNAGIAFGSASRSPPSGRAITMFGEA